MPATPGTLKEYPKKFPGRLKIQRDMNGASGANRRRSIHGLVNKEIISYRDALCLYRLSIFLQAQNILDLGTCLGYSAFAMGKARPGAQITSIDNDVEVQQLAGKHLMEEGVQNIKMHHGLFRDILPQILKNSPGFDIIFLDGDHRREETVYLVQLLLPHLKRHGVIAIHDIHHSEEMMEAWELVQGFPEVTLTISTFSMGLLFVSEGFSREAHRLRWY